MNYETPDNTFKGYEHFIARGGTNRAAQVSAEQRGLVTFRDNSGGKVYLGITSGIKTIIFRGGYCSESDVQQARTAKSKQKTRNILQKIGCNVLPGRGFSEHELEEALCYALQIEFPIVIKPNSANKGKDVKIITSEDELSLVWKSYFAERDRIIIEKFYQAEEYRFTLVDGKVCGVVKREPANIVGDGSLTIEELVKEKNRLKKERTPHPEISIDQDLLHNLAEQGLDLDDMPEVGVKIYLRKISNVSQGGDAIDYTDKMHSSYVEAIESASAPFNKIVFTGWDVFIKDYTVPADDSNWVVIEVNDRPMLSLHHYPFVGQAKDIAGAAWDKIFFNKPVKGILEQKYMARFVISGEVVGVGYRKWAKKKAFKMGMDGFCRNRTDGTVEVVISSSEEQNIPKFEKLLWTGPQRAKVTDVKKKPRRQNVRKGFRIRKTKVLEP